MLYRQLERLAKLGYTYNTGPELEFFLFSKEGDDISPLPHDRGGYFDLSTDLASHVRKDMVLALEEMGIEVEASHHEVAIGQHEIDFEYGDALADRRPRDDLQVHPEGDRPEARPARDLHAEADRGHQRLRHARPPELRSDLADGKNAFVDETDAYGLSTLAKHFIAGQLPTRAACAR